MKKLKILQAVCENVKYVEVNLFRRKVLTEKAKPLFLKVISDDNDIAEYSGSQRWEDAFLNAFDKVRDHIISR